MKDMKIKNRLIISFAIICAAMMVLSGIGSISVAILARTMDVYASQVQGSVNLMSQIRTSFECAQKEMYRGLGSDHASVIQDATQSAQASADEVRNSLESLKDFYLGDPEDLTKLQDIIQRADVYFLDIMSAMNNSDVNQQEVWQNLEQEFSPILDEMDAQISSMMTVTNNYGTETLQQMTTVINITRVTLPVVGLVMLGVAFILAKTTTKAIVPH